VRPTSVQFTTDITVAWTQDHSNTQRSDQALQHQDQHTLLFVEYLRSFKYKTGLCAHEAIYGIGSTSGRFVKQEQWESWQVKRKRNEKKWNLYSAYRQ